MTTHVSLSGGMDSTAALARTLAYAPDREPVTAVAFDYGQRHVRELDASRAVAAHYGVAHRVLDLRGLLHGSALVDPAIEVPEGHYAAPSMASTVVGGRNLLFASAMIASATAGDTIVLGVHAGDHHVYPDCRPEFIEALSAAASAYDVAVCAPWVHVTKDEIIRRAPDAPYHLTWSCYNGRDAHCGRCGTCVERREAFALAGHPDPTVYEESAA